MVLGEMHIEELVHSSRQTYRNPSCSELWKTHRNKDISSDWGKHQKRSFGSASSQTFLGRVFECLQPNPKLPPCAQTLWFTQVPWVAEFSQRVSAVHLSGPVKWGAIPQEFPKCWMSTLDKTQSVISNFSSQIEQNPSSLVV